MKKAHSAEVKNIHKGNSHHQAAQHADLTLENSTMAIEPLNATDTQTLLYMIEEEKMARDVYDVLFEQTGIRTFDKISDSEQKHYDTLLSTAVKLGVDTTLLSTEAGVFSNDTLQSLYDQLILQASTSTNDAIAVGIAIEQTDIADLQATVATTEVTLLGQVYANLLNGSEHHLTAFENIA